MKRIFSKTYVLILGYVIIGAVLIGLFSTGVIHVSTTSSSPSFSKALPATVIYIYIASSTRLEFVSCLHSCPVGFDQNARQFNLSSTYLITGAFTSTSSAEIYVVPTKVMLNDTSFPIRFYTYFTGNVTSGNIDVTLSAGSYYFVIANPTTVADKITITQNIEATSVFLFT